MITYLKIQNFKSLEQVELKLGPLHVLVGANGSGKSNLFDAFQFLRELAEIGQQAVHSRGGFAQLVWGGDLKRKIGFAIQFQFGNDRKPTKIVYQIEISGGPNYSTISHEKVAAINGRKEEPLLVATTGGRLSIRDVSGKSFELGRHDQVFKQFEDEERYGILAHFVRELKSWALYNFETSLLRKPNVVRRDFNMQTAGLNFSSVLHAIQTEQREKFSAIESLLRAAVPGLRQLLTTLTPEGLTYLSLEEEALPLRIPAWAISDGTLRLLAQLAALYSPAPPALACYEEPENYMHPAWLPLIADALKNAAHRNQILVSTHSPYLLNFFSPENLLVVDKKDGKSQFKSVKGKRGLKEALHTLGLGEIWYSGELGGMP